MDRELKVIPAARVALEQLPLTPPDKIVFHPVNTLGGYRAVKILAQYRGRWLYCRAKTRDVFETPGGHAEPGETALEAAKRELYEETGAVEYDIEPVFDFKWRMREVWNCQMLFARIHTLGEMPGYEMEETALCEGLPEKLRFPDVTEAVFRKVQTWMSQQNAKDELLDVYDAGRNRTGRLHRRADPVPPGDYHLAVLILLQNTRGEYLITKRAPEKGYAGMWENPGGAAQAGDGSVTAAVRELKEETGIDVLPEDGTLELTFRRNHLLFDAWRFVKDFSLSEVVLRDKETVDARFASRGDILALIDAGKFLAGEALIEYFKGVENNG